LARADEDDLLRNEAADVIWGGGRPVHRPDPKLRRHSSDILVAGLGIALGFGCAVFPWYVFFNQEQFGIRALKFQGGSGETPEALVYQPELIGRALTPSEAPVLDLDLTPTGTLPDKPEESMQAIPAPEQAFPGDAAGFRLVHVANGRAMIEDSEGLWMVHAGSSLPDGSLVVSIEQRDGSWALVTSADKIVPLSR